MKKEILNNNFNTILLKKISGRSQLTNTLVEILNIEKEAIYRRLRGEVPFTFAEVALISQKLGISIDEMLGTQSDKRRPFSFQLCDFETPSSEDFIMYENYLRILDMMKTDPSFLICETWTTLPLPICYKYPYLLRFYIFKWAYQAHNSMPAISYEKTNLSDKYLQFGLKTLDLYMEAAETHIILANDLFANLKKDLKFFLDIRMISQKSIEKIGQELRNYIDYLEELATYGKYEETGNKVYLYISEVEIETNYSLLESADIYVSMLRTLVLSSAATTDKTTYLNMKNWFTALKRLSTHISVSGEKERIQYFKTQRELIKELKG